MKKDWSYFLVLTVLLSGCTSYQTAREGEASNTRFSASCLNTDRMCLREACKLQTVTLEAYKRCLNYFGLVFESKDAPQMTAS